MSLIKACTDRIKIAVNVETNVRIKMSTKLTTSEICDIREFSSIPSITLPSVKRIYIADEIQNCEMPYCIINEKYRPSQMSRNKNIIRAAHSVPAIRLCNDVCKNFACIDESNEKLFVRRK